MIVGSSLTRDAASQAVTHTPLPLRYLVFAFFFTGSVIGAINIAAAQHLPHLWLVAAIYAVGAGSVFGALVFLRLPATVASLFGKPAFLAAVLVLLASADLHHYSGSVHKPHPQTSQLALQMPAEALLHGHNPYHVRLPDDAPISPGPGWIAAVTPLVLLHAGAAIGAVALAAAVFMLRRKPAAAGVLLALLMLQPHLQSQFANGGDLYAVVLLLGAWTILLLDADRATPDLLLIAGVGGVLATARLALLPIVLLPVLALFFKRRGQAVLCALVVTATAALLNLGFFLWSRAEHDEFQPLHIFARGGAALSLPLREMTVGLLIASAVYLFRHMRANANDALLGMALALAALFAPVGLGEWVRTSHDLTWEGCNYLLLPLPLLALWLVRTRPVRY